MKGQFKKGKGNNVWYLIIFGDANVLRIVQSDNDYMRIKFESNDNLPADNIVNLHLVTIIIRSAFAENGKFYPQLFLDDALYELKKCYDIKKLIFQKELM